MSFMLFEFFLYVKISKKAQLGAIILNKKLIKILLIIFIFLLCGCESNNSFEDACLFSEELGAVKVNGKYGYLDTSGNMIIPPTYDEANPFNDNIAIIKKDGLYGAIDKENNIIIPIEYDDLLNFSSHDNPEDSSYFEKFFFCPYICAKKNGKYGCINKNNDIAVDFTYDNPMEINYSNNNTIAIIIDNDNKQGIIDLNSDFIVEPKYSNVLGNNNQNSNILVTESTDGNLCKFGFINLDTRKVIDSQYDSPPFFNDNIAAVCVKRKYGFINSDGDYIIDPSYLAASNFSEGLAAVQMYSETSLKYGYINKENELVIPAIYDFAMEFYEGNAVVVIDNKEFVIDTSGNILETSPSVVMQYQHDSDSPYPIIEHPFDDTGNSKTIIKDKNGKILLESDYDSITPLPNKQFIVEKNNHWGCINERFIESIPLIYKDLRFVDNTHFICNKDNLYGVLDNNNKELIPLEYDDIKIVSDTLLSMQKKDDKKNEKYYILNLKTNTILNEVYDEVKETFFSSSYVPVRKDKKWFYLDENGEKLVSK